MFKLDDYENYARQSLTSFNWNHVSDGAEANVTLKDNIEAFKRYKIIPRLLKNVSKLDTKTTVLGFPISFPVCISPSASHRRAHAIAEVGTAQGAAAANTIFTLSSYASCTIEEVAEGSPDGLKFFQMYIFNKRDLVVELVQRAERAGYKALVITVDSPTSNTTTGQLWSMERDCIIRQSALMYVNLLRESEAQLSDPKKFDFCETLIDPSLTWDDIKWLRSVTRLPVILKGILSAEDAVNAVEVGADGILVSNHGGRQLDTVPATIDVLSDIVKAVKGRCEVYLDGGVRTGTDVLKALALGARAVFI